MRLSYLFDPLCGWCYGASPNIARLAKTDGIFIRLSPIGLFAGQSARRMDAGFANFAWQNDLRIARLTGQPFTEIYRDRILGAEGSIFDSGPATLAIVAVGMDEDESREVEVLQLLQKARYETGRNTSDLSTVADVMEEHGFEAAAARLRAQDEALLSRYAERISAARAEMSALSVDGVPALVLEEGDSRLMHASALIGNFDRLKAQLAA